MLNEFKKNNFWVKYDENNYKRYYLYLNCVWIEVTKDVYSVYKASYQKMYRDQLKDKDRIIYYENADDFYPYLYESQEYVTLDNITKNDEIIRLQKALCGLPEAEKRIITAIYFENMTERELAKELQMSQQKLHYRKKRVLEKLRDLLLKN